ncbi:Hypothetical predicted protein [Pelobates cultripes]|uniref:Uncharacterized protein n=1 Tax=Pelobates cultripes TaxID=61616 RepID=A0AAD1TD79_PELCU|nr:Hypothetical predicted protein [Pelobates cultripes]
MEETQEAHNHLIDQVNTLQVTISTMENKLMDIEDRARRNNLRLWGIPETVAPADLQAYLHEFFHVLSPDTPSAMLLLDRAHRIPKPQHLPPSVPRDVILCAHYHHIKEIILKQSRNNKNIPSKYTDIKIFPDLSAATLRRRKTFQPITTILRQHQIAYRWGYPLKLLISKEGATKVLNSPEDGEKLLREWNLPTPSKPTRETAALHREWRKA